MVSKVAKLIIIAIPLLIFIFGFIYGRFTAIKIVKIRQQKPNNLRIAVMSDFHIAAGGIGALQAAKCLKLAAKYKPDAILLLGDFVTGKGGVQYIKSVFSVVDLPIYAVPGNHDYWTGIELVSRALRDAGVKLLVNDSAILEKNGEKVAIVGIDDLWLGKPDFKRAFANIPPNIPVILLSHNPDAILHPHHVRAMLILSGHTHGGFWWMPYRIRWLFWKVTGIKFIPKTEFGWRFPYGLRKIGDTFIYITSGVTKGYAIPRWFTRPEVAIIEFR